MALLVAGLAGCGSDQGRTGAGKGAGSAARPGGSQSPESKATAKSGTAATAKSGTATAAKGAAAPSGRSATDRTAGTTAKTSAQAGGSAAARSAEPGHVRLRVKGCVEFDPPWATIVAGQTVTWHNDSAERVTVRVASGAFERSEFVVPARGAVTSGPARSGGNFAITSVPGACQGVPRGVRGTGPGVYVVADRR